MPKTKWILAVAGVLSLLYTTTPSVADIDLFSGQRIASSGDWRLEYRDTFVNMPDGGGMVFGDMCALITGSENTWLSLGFMAGWVNVTIYAKAWDHPRRSRTILMRGGGLGVRMADAIFEDDFIQTSLPPNENPENSIRRLAEAAGQGSIELMRMPGNRLMVTFSGRGLENLLDRAITCGLASRN